jgi:hypothetical protein
MGSNALLRTLFFAACLVAGAAAAEETHGDAISALVEQGKVALGFRYRYEFVDDEAFDENANASTLRSRLTLQSGTWRDVAFLVEFDDVREAFADDFNAGEGNTPGRTEYPLVADPEGTELNQAYVDYRGFTGTTLRLGRQRINLDNQRFVGGVAWRQNEQTFDAFSAGYDRGPWHLFYGYVEKVNRIWGEDVPAGEHEQDGTHLVNARYDLPGIGTLTGYYYRIDNHDQAASSTGTVGGRFAGQRDVAELGVRYAAEFARQSDVANNPVSFDADYSLIEAGIVIDRTLDFGFGWEVLEGNATTAGEAFRTPLATLHAFNGWVDKFLTTPQEGLDDRHAKLKGTFGPTIFELRFHRFEGEDTGSKLGDEWNVLVGHQFHERIRGDFKFGDFRSDDPRYSDTMKIWLYFTVQLP